MQIFNYKFYDGYELKAHEKLDIFSKRRLITAHGKIVAAIPCGWRVKDA